MASVVVRDNYRLCYLLCSNNMVLFSNRSVRAYLIVLGSSCTQFGFGHIFIMTVFLITWDWVTMCSAVFMFSMSPTQFYYTRHTWLFYFLKSYYALTGCYISFCMRRCYFIRFPKALLILLNLYNDSCAVLFFFIPGFSTALTSIRATLIYLRNKFSKKTECVVSSSLQKLNRGCGGLKGGREGGKLRALIWVSWWRSARTHTPVAAAAAAEPDNIYLTPKKILCYNQTAHSLCERGNIWNE